MKVIILNRLGKTQIGRTPIKIFK